MSHEENEHHNPEESGRAGKTNPEIRYVPLDIRAIEGDNGDRIDLFDIFKSIWNGRKMIFKTVAVFLVLGLVVALGSAVEYTSEVRVLPESQTDGRAQMGGLGGLGGLAQQFGVNIGGSQASDAIPPKLYPDVTQSVTFLQELMEYEVSLPENPSETVTLQTYFLEYSSPPFLSTLTRYTVYLPFTVLRGIRSLFRDEEKRGLTPMDQQRGGGQKGERLIRMNSEQWQLVYILRGRITATWNMENSAVTISVKMPDPVLSADVANQVVQLLTEYITEYRTEKMRRDLEFIQERYEEAEQRFEDAQKELAVFNDQNRGQLTAMARTEEQLLQSRYDLTFGVYNSLAQQVEQARLKLQEETPVINILDQAVVPDRKSEPRRGFILAVFVILGTIVGAGLIFGMQIWRKFKYKMSEH